MAASSLPPEILASLRREASRLRAQHGAAVQTVKNLASELHRIEKAVSTLLGERKTRTTTTSSGDSLSDEEAVLFVERILKATGPLKEPELTQKLNELAEMEGRSRQGLHFLFKKAIKDPRFSWNGARWQLG